VASDGPGTELKKILAKFGITERSGCGCKKMARKMDAWGTAGCHEHMPEIVEYMLKEAKKRTVTANLPGMRTIIRRFVFAAIRRSERASKAAKKKELADDDRPKLVLYSHNLGAGGAERWLVNLAQYLDRNRVNVLGLALEGDEGADKSLLSLAKEVTHVTTDLEETKELIGSSDITLFWSRTPPGKPQKCKVFTAHGVDQWARRRWKQLPKWVRTTAVSEFVAKKMPGEPTVIYNGIDPRRVAIHNRPDEVKRSLGIHHKVYPIIGYLGRIHHQKYPQAAGLAAAGLNSLDGVRSRALYVGAEPGEKEKVRKELKQYGGNPIVVERTEKVGDYLQIMDCFVLASPSEGFSLAMIEAWMVGVPVVSTPVGAVEELEAIYGPLVSRVEHNANPTKLKKAVRHALSLEFKEVVQRAKVLAEREFTVKAMANRWAGYIEELAKK
jgi:glycosyltransferase involved in cell wall biosynthesis